jgi:hypothetical protein
MQRLLARRGPALTILMAMWLLIAGCHRSPLQPGGPAQPAVSGNYVGVGTVNGRASNILMVVIGPDSVGRLGGSITYQSLTSNFEEIYSDSTGDTLQFRYRRDTTLHRGWALISISALSVHLTEPVSASFQLNRETNGTNMTGLWSGLMSSTLIQDVRTASATLDQTGQLYSGEIEVTFFEATHFQITSGAADNTAFQMSGTMLVGASSTEALFQGSFATADSIRGYWQAGPNGSVDSGEFGFVRHYD